MKKLFQQHKSFVIFALSFVAAFILFVFLFNFPFSLSSSRFSLSPDFLVYPGDIGQTTYFPEDRKDTASFEEDFSSFSNDRLVIKNASLALVVDNSEKKAGDVREIVQRLGGYVESSDMYGLEKERRIEIKIRIPSTEFDLALREIKDLATQVSREQVDVQDVGEEYVDLEARLNNLRTSESRFLQILEEADTVEEILSVEREIGRVRGEIERAEGRMKYLERRVAMSTVSVSLISESEIEILGITWSPLREVKLAYNRLVEGLVEFAKNVIHLVFVLPLIALWAIIIFLVFAGSVKFFRFFRGRGWGIPFSKKLKEKGNK